MAVRMGLILHILTDPGLDESVRRAAALFGPLAAAGWPSHVAVMRGPRGQLPKLSGDVPVHDLGELREIDPRPWLKLRRVVSAVSPSVIHAWGMRATRLAIPLTRRPVVASEVSPESWFDQWLIRRAEIATGPACAVPAAVDRESILRELELPNEARIIACSGVIERGHGFMEAAWVFDILKYVYRDL